MLTLMMILSLVITGAGAADGNLLVNGDFNTSNLSFWWMRSDWNGGTWSYSATGGYEDSGCLIASGTGAGTADQNAGLFYTGAEGTETYLELMEGEVYKVAFMVNRSNAGSAGVYMDVNEGALGSGTASGSGWEKVEFTFTAPAAAIKLRMVVHGLAEGKRVRSP